MRLVDCQHAEPAPRPQESLREELADRQPLGRNQEYVTCIAGERRLGGIPLVPVLRMEYF